MGVQITKTPAASIPQQPNEALPVLQGDVSVDLKPFDTLANIVEGLTLQT